VRSAVEQRDRDEGGSERWQQERPSELARCDGARKLAVELNDRENEQSSAHAAESEGSSFTIRTPKV
jgi:hypothetical protein